MYFKTESEIKICPDKQKWREVITSTYTLQEIFFRLKEIIPEGKTDL